MSSWYWRMIAFKAAFALTCLASYLNAEDIIQKLPFCDPNTPSVSNKDLIIVSTLDGKITAFSSDTGIKAWDLQTQPLLTSTLHQVELTAGGKWIRLVPSLKGTLYSLSGDTIEPLPFDAEQLLFSSFKYSDDLVIAGARESLWMGVDVHTGGVVYQCGTKGCNSEKETAGASGDVLVLRRSSNVVRALEPRTGTEKWNFSVAEHHLAVSNSRVCDSIHEGPTIPEYVVAVAVPEGVVAVRDHETQMLLWQQKLEAPVASMWRLRGGSLQNIDVLWAATKSLSTGNFVQASPPALYIGLHNQQLYVQEGAITVKKADTAVSNKPMPFKLKFTRPLIAGPNTAIQQKPDHERNALSLIALYDNGQTGNQGFFLYMEEKCSKAVQVSDVDLEPDLLDDDSDNDDRQVHMHVHVYSLWYWWKEVVLIAVSSALLMNLMIWPRLFVPRSRPPSPVTDQGVVVVERHYSQPSVTEYSGRYYNDFEPLRCLGRGGFGVVFEARNKIDHRSYAVKRITLPRRESKRERVLREVRALAKLEHEHIVRYFNAWLEEPPPNWQQEMDAIWKRELDGVSVTMNEDYTSQKETNETNPYSLPTKSITKPANVLLNLQPEQWDKSVDACFDALEYEKPFEEPKRNRSLSCNDSFSIEFIDHNSKSVSKTNHTTGNSLEVPNDVSSLSNTLSLSKHTGGGDQDDSFIVFANSEDCNHNNSKGIDVLTNEATINKHLEKVRQCDGLSKSESEPSQLKKKKGHRRHWSLDMCVRPSPERTMYLYIQMQLCLRDSLHDWLRNNRDYCRRGEMAITFFNQIVSAVEYVHLAGLIHRDLKPSNILFSPDGKVKVGDFGLVTAISDSSQDESTNGDTFDAQQRHTYKVGTHLYMSPEQLCGLPYDYKVDIYSLGLVMFELLQPFHTEAERVRSLLSLRKGHYPDTFKNSYGKEMEVLKLMLSEDPSLRPTATGVRSRAPLYHHTQPHTLHVMA